MYLRIHTCKADFRRQRMKYATRVAEPVRRFSISCLLPTVAIISIYFACHFGLTHFGAMAEIGFLTTRSTEWSRGIPSSSPWTDRGDGFHVDLDDDQEPPLKILDTITGQGTVVEKRKSPIDGRLVAVKKLVTYGDSRVNTELKNEVEVLRSLKHYHSVSIFGTYLGDTFSIVMDPCATCDLWTYLSAPTSVTVKKLESRYDPRDKFLPTMMGCLAHGLQYLHKEPRVQHYSGEERIVRHRDITPTNIVLDGSRVLYTDFGLSKFVTATQTGSSGPSRKTLMVRTTPQS